METRFSFRMDASMKALLIAAAAMAALPAAAQDSASRNLSAGCAICHGTGGNAVAKDFTTLAGLPQDHIAKQMRDFRDGKRPATVMHQIAKGYTDAQIDAIAAWFAAQKR
jgi:cytochrome c553